VNSSEEFLGCLDNRWTNEMDMRKHEAFLDEVIVFVYHRSIGRSIGAYGKDTPSCFLHKRSRALHAWKILAKFLKRHIREEIS
jgi:hypothetical protein